MPWTVPVLLLLTALSVAYSPGDKPATAFTLDDVAFMTGTWQNETDGAYIEEIWSAPSGDNMMGMFRYVQEGHGVFYEMMIVEANDEGIVMRLKHFNAGLIGWEEKAEVHSFYLKEVSDAEAVFEQKDEMKRLRYVHPGPEELVVYLEEREGEVWSRETFAFRRAG